MLRGSKHHEVAEELVMSHFENGHATLAPAKASLTTWRDLVPPAPMPVCSSPFAKITLSVASCWNGAAGASSMSSLRPTFREARIEVFLAMLQTVQKRPFGK